MFLNKSTANLFADYKELGQSWQGNLPTQVDEDDTLKQGIIDKLMHQISAHTQNGNVVKKYVDEEDKLNCQIDSVGQKREMTCINESGLYSLILSSKLPSAKEFIFSQI